MLVFIILVLIILLFIILLFIIKGRGVIEIIFD